MSKVAILGASFSSALMASTLVRVLDQQKIESVEPPQDLDPQQFPSRQARRAYERQLAKGERR